jgi:uncharacterized Zn-finger protein
VYPGSEEQQLRRSMCRLICRTLGTDPIIVAQISRRNKATAAQRVETANMRYRCEECGQKCLTQHNLTIHMRSHSGEEPFLCECGKTFKQMSNLTSHINTKHKGIVREKNILCDHCSVKCATQNEMTVHMRSHTQEKPYRCSVCTVSFSTQGTLTKHELRHTADKSQLRTKPCNYKDCHKAFESNSGLMAHIRSVHLKERPYPCAVDDCDETFATKLTSTKHVARVHNGGRTVDCKYKGCASKFFDKGDMMKHMRVHTNERPYRCELENSGEAFKQIGELIKHKRRSLSKLAAKLRKVQENRVRTILSGFTVTENGYHDYKNNVPNPDKASAFVDFTVEDIGNVCVNLECDKEAHYWYELLCELTRMVSTSTKLFHV